MNLWILNHYAGPPKTTPATRTYDISAQLVQRGHQVTIFACSFNHYSFAEEQLKPWQLFRFDELDGIRFVWIRGVPYQRNGVKRLLNMVVYALLTFWIGLLLQPKPDAIIGVTVHPFAPFTAYLLSRIRRAVFWVDITDIWPQVLIDLGHMSADGLQARVIRSIEHFSLGHADRVSSVMPHVDAYLADIGLPDKPFVWIPHGISAARIRHVPPSFAPPTAGFTVAYAGGFAPGHAMDVIVEAAAILQREAPHIRMLLIGDGPEMPTVRRMIEELKVTNTTLTGLLPKDQVYGELAQAHAFVVTGHALPVYRYGVSYNKMYDYLLVGRPIISALSASNDPVAEAGAGVSLPPENPRALATMIQAVAALPVEWQQRMGQRGREYVIQKYEFGVIAGKLECELQQDIAAYG